MQTKIETHYAVNLQVYSLIKPINKTQYFQQEPIVRKDIKSYLSELDACGCLTQNK
jgi:hypothetical protein